MVKDSVMYRSMTGSWPEAQALQPLHQAPLGEHTGDPGA